MPRNDVVTLSCPYLDDDDSTSEGTPEKNDWKDSFFGKQKETKTVNDLGSKVTLENKKTLILATLVPDEILFLEKFEGASPKKIVGVLMLINICGFTPLSERYYNTGKGGIYKLTAILNVFLGLIIETIYRYGGDVIKFTGNAFLAQWKADKSIFISHIIDKVISCALFIQQAYGTYETDVKVNLRLKIALSAGKMYFSQIGKKDDLSYILTGLPVLEAKFLESHCLLGDVRVTANAWEHCFSRNYNHLVTPDGHVIVKSLLYESTDDAVSKPITALSYEVQVTGNTVVENLPALTWHSQEITYLNTNETKINSKSLRVNILKAEFKNVGGEIRKFIIKPVLEQIDANQPLEYLTEMQNITILVTRMKISTCPVFEFITVIDNVYQCTCQVVDKSMGFIKKTILFDKDTMMLAIFGLRGFKHDSPAQVALKCAYTVRKAILSIDRVLEVSIGVVSGKAYCGVVGHPLRRDFTVIGAVVNKAAQIIYALPNKVCCDELTFISSKLSANNFILRPAQHSKGIKDIGHVYEYTEVIKSTDVSDIEMMLPILNRTDEMEYFDNWIDPSHAAYKKKHALLIVGEAQVGKTKVLESMIKTAKSRKLKVSKVSLSNIHSTTPYLALRQIIDQLLGDESNHNEFFREEKIVDIIEKYSDNLCYLNKILNVRFPYTDKIYEKDEKMRIEHAQFIFSKLILNLKGDFLVAIDDIQFIDSYSKTFISMLIKVPHLFVVMSITRNRFNTLDDWLFRVFTNENINKIILGKLEVSLLPALACQILDVVAVPKELIDFITKASKFSPGNVESLILHLYCNETLATVKYIENNSETLSNQNCIFPDTNLLKPVAINDKDQQAVNENLDNVESRICCILDYSGLNTKINKEDINTMIIKQINKLTPYQQLLIKIASVIGTVFTRELLQNTMYENDELLTARAVHKFFVLRILSCANYRKSLHNSIPNSQTTSLYIYCNCIIDYREDKTNLPKFAFCTLMKFRSKVLRNICYKLLPADQKKEVHSRVVRFIERQKHLCESCGSQVMFARPLSVSHSNLRKNLNSAVTNDNETLKNKNELKFKKVMSDKSVPFVTRNTCSKSIRPTGEISEDCNNDTNTNIIVDNVTPTYNDKRR